MVARKGSVVVGQSGGPTAVINNSLVGVVHEALQHEEIGEIYGMLHGIVGVLREELVDLRRESADTLETLRNTPASALGTVRYKITNDDYDRLLQVLVAHDVRYFFYIGGNDSADTTHKICNMAAQKGHELYAIGVPKTVDNDLAMTDHCPGYGSAARFVAAAIRNTGYDTEAMGESGPIKFMEIMGRNAGWLTAAAALAKERPDDPPQLVYVPERGVSIEQVVDDVRYWYRKLGYCVVAVSEGLKDEHGGQFGTTNGTRVEVDAFGHVRKGGVIEYLCDVLKSSIGVTIRYDKPSYLQRSFGELQSSVDREEAYLVGRAAVRATLAGESDKMVTLIRKSSPTYAIETSLAPLSQVANVERMLPPDFINERGNGVTQDFMDYARPLIGGPLLRYTRLARKLAPKRGAAQ